MTKSRFIALVGALIWRQSDGKYLILQRSEKKDFAAGEWECVTGRVEHGESFFEAVRRETQEELGQDVQVEFLIGTAHFYRGAVTPENETIGVHYACSIKNPEDILLSKEHTASRWVTAHEIEDMFPAGHWLRKLVNRTEQMRQLLPEEIILFNRLNGTDIK